MIRLAKDKAMISQFASMASFCVEYACFLHVFAAIERLVSCEDRPVLLRLASVQRTVLGLQSDGVLLPYACSATSWWRR